MKTKQKTKNYLYSIWQYVSDIPGWLRFLWLMDYFTEKELDKLAIIDDGFLKIEKRLKNSWDQWKRKELPKTEHDWINIFPEYDKKKISKKKYYGFLQNEIEIARGIDLVSVVEEYVDLKESGTNRLVGVCPFHDEKNPSFTIYNDSNRFYCFGCQANGDVIAFIRKIENLTFKQAIRVLCCYVNGKQVA